MSRLDPFFESGYGGGWRWAVLSVAACLLGSLAPPQLAAETTHLPSILLKLIEEVDVPAREAGVLQAVPAEEGQIVKRNDLLAQLEDTQQQLALQQARAALSLADLEAENRTPEQLAEEELRVAQSDLERALKSREKFAESISPSELDHMRLRVAQARLQGQQAEHERKLNEVKRQVREQDVQLAENQCEQRRIGSPLDGMVVEVYRRAGEWVEPGEKVARVIRIDKLRAEGFLELTKSPKDLVGTPVTVTVDVPGTGPTRVVGRLVFVSPEVDPVNRQVRIAADVENQDLRLIPGLRGTMTIDHGK
jgi:macrolide-specific efflux system membrane fusion protein